MRYSNIIQSTILTNIQLFSFCSNNTFIIPNIDNRIIEIIKFKKLKFLISLIIYYLFLEWI